MSVLDLNLATAYYCVFAAFLQNFSRGLIN